MMLDNSTTRLPTAAERDLWAFDLAKRIIRDGRNCSETLLRQQEESIQQFKGDGDGNR